MSQHWQTHKFKHRNKLRYASEPLFWLSITVSVMKRQNEWPQAWMFLDCIDTKSNHSISLILQEDINKRVHSATGDYRLVLCRFTQILLALLITYVVEEEDGFHLALRLTPVCVSRQIPFWSDHIYIWLARNSWTLGKVCSLSCREFNDNLIQFTVKHEARARRQLA